MSIVASSLIAQVKVEGDTETKQKLGEVSASVDKAGGVIGGLKGAFSGAFAWISGGGLGNVISAFDTLRGAFGNVLQESLDAQDELAQTNKVLESTHDASGMTADAIVNLAGSFSHLTKFTDDQVQIGENLLLTFTNIGKNVFPLATQTMLDLSQAMGQDVKSSAIQLGKALNDPLTGMTALQRVGVTFDDTEKKLIKTYMSHNELAKAQGVILKELQKEFGGSAEAAGKTFGGQMAILNQRIDDVKQNIGDALLPWVTKFTGFVSDHVLPTLTTLSDWFGKTGLPALVNFTGGIYDSVTQSKPFRDILAEVGTDLKIVGSAFQEIFSPIKKTTEAVNPLVAIFQKWKPVITDIAGDVKILAGDVVTFVGGIVNATEKSGLLQSDLQFLHDILPAVGTFLVNVGGAINQNLLPPLESLITNVLSAEAGFVTWADKSGVAKTTLDTLGGAIQLTTEILGPLITAVSDVVGWLGGGGAGTDTLAFALSAVATAFAVLKIADTTAQFSSFIGKLQEGDGIISNLASSVKDKLAKAFDDFLANQAPNLKASMDSIKVSAEEAATAEAEVAAAPADQSAEGWFTRLEGSLGGVGTAADETSAQVGGIGIAAETSAGEVAVSSTEMETSLAGVGTAASGAEGGIAAIGTTAATAGAGVVSGFGAVALGIMTAGIGAIVGIEAYMLKDATPALVNSWNNADFKEPPPFRTAAAQMNYDSYNTAHHVKSNFSDMNKNVTTDAQKMAQAVVASGNQMADQMVAKLELMRGSGVTSATKFSNSVMAVFNEMKTSGIQSLSDLDDSAKSYLQEIQAYVDAMNGELHLASDNINARKNPTGSSLNQKNRYASGTDYAPGGDALVAEAGAELVVGPRSGYLPRGSRVIPHDQSMAMLGGGWGGGGSGYGNQTIIIELDGQKLAEVTGDRHAREVRLRYGRRVF